MGETPTVDVTPMNDMVSPHTVETPLHLGLATPRTKAIAKATIKEGADEMKLPNEILNTLGFFERGCQKMNKNLLKYQEDLLFEKLWELKEHNPLFKSFTTEDMEILKCIMPIFNISDTKAELFDMRGKVFYSDEIEDHQKFEEALMRIGIEQRYCVIVISNSAFVSFNDGPAQELPMGSLLLSYLSSKKNPLVI